MLFIRCQCGCLLGNKELVFEEGITKFCNDNNIEENSKDIRLAEFKQKLINDICSRPCCKMNLLTYIDVVKIVGSGNKNLVK